MDRIWKWNGMTQRNGVCACWPWRAVEHAHAQLSHWRLKPSNVMVHESAPPSWLDPGIAGLLTTGAQTDHQLTQKYRPAVHTAWRALEQIRAAAPSASRRMYSLA